GPFVSKCAAAECTAVLYAKMYERSPMSTAAALDVDAAVKAVEAPVCAKKINAGGGERIRGWPTRTRYADHKATEIEHIEAAKWKELDDVFWTVIPFGTGGRRGKMYPIGSNAINDRTIGESAQGLAAYVKEHHPPGTKLACAVAYDTRHRSRHFAELTAEIMFANGFKGLFLDGDRS